MSTERGELDIKTEAAGDATTLSISGEIDLHTSPQLRIRLQEILDKKATRLILDLTGVGYMDSSGVGTIVEAKRRADRGKSKIVLTGLQPRVRSLFEITQLDKFFTITENIEQAKEA